MRFRVNETAHSKHNGRVFLPNPAHAEQPSKKKVLGDDTAPREVRELQPIPTIIIYLTWTLHGERIVTSYYEVKIKSRTSSSLEAR